MGGIETANLVASSNGSIDKITIVEPSVCDGGATLALLPTAVYELVASLLRASDCQGRLRGQLLLRLQNLLLVLLKRRRLRVTD